MRRLTALAKTLQHTCLGLDRVTVKILKDVLERVERWPEEAQTELAQMALEIDASLRLGKYMATPSELAGIDRGFEATRAGRFSTDAQVAEVFRKHRPA